MQQEALKGNHLKEKVDSRYDCEDSESGDCHQ